MTDEERGWFVDRVLAEESFARMGSDDVTRPIHKVKLIIRKLLDREFYEAKELAAMLGMSECYLKALLEHESLRVGWETAQDFESNFGIPADIIMQFEMEYRDEILEFWRCKG